VASTLLVDRHVSYIQSLGDNKDDLAYHMTAHLRLNAVYWGLTALCIMNRKDALDREEMISFVLSCWDEEAGAFGSHPDHDAHLLSTLSAIQILIIHDALDRLNVPRVVDFILSLQQPSGIFFWGQVWGDGHKVSVLWGVCFVIAWQSGQTRRGTNCVLYPSV